jgi:hypothetical protein
MGHRCKKNGIIAKIIKINITKSLEQLLSGRVSSCLFGITITKTSESAIASLRLQ